MSGKLAAGILGRTVLVFFWFSDWNSLHYLLPSKFRENVIELNPRGCALFTNPNVSDF